MCRHLPGQTHLISAQRSDGLFLLEIDGLFEELYHAFARAERNFDLKNQ
jgi:hypothetical protein